MNYFESVAGLQTMTLLNEYLSREVNKRQICKSFDFSETDKINEIIKEGWKVKEMVSNTLLDEIMVVFEK